MTKLLGNRNSKSAALTSKQMKTRFTGVSTVHGKDDNLALVRFHEDGDGQYWIELPPAAKEEAAKVDYYGASVGEIRRLNMEIFGHIHEPKMPSPPPGYRKPVMRASSHDRW